MISILCNAGMRGRHWKQMSDIVGFNITPDSGTTLRKMLNLKLEPFIEKFDGISVAASKVSQPWRVVELRSLDSDAAQEKNTNWQ